MPTPDEKPYPVVRMSHKGKLLDTVSCATLQDADEVVERLRENDPRGWYAEIEIRPMTMSELAYELMA